MSYRSNAVISDFHTETTKYYRNKRVIVTGGAGFIGSHAVEQLLLMGAKPIVVTRQKNPYFLKHLNDQVSLIHCDLEDAKSTASLMKNADVVLHMAAKVAGLEYNSKHPASIFQDNLTSFMNTIRAAQQNGIQRFIVTSSACVYPRHCSIPTPESEGFVGEPEPTNSGYGWAKRMEEYLAAQYAFEYNYSVAIARPYNAYGPRDNFADNSSHVIPALIKKALAATNGEFPVWGDGSHSRSFLYVDDFARGCLEVGARYPKAEALNIGANEEVTIKDTALHISALVTEMTGRSVRPVFNPQGLTGQPRRKCDTTKIEKEIQFKTKMPFIDGLRQTIRWYLDEGHTLSSHS